MQATLRERTRCQPALRLRVPKQRSTRARVGVRVRFVQRCQAVSGRRAWAQGMMPSVMPASASAARRFALRRDCDRKEPASPSRAEIRQRRARARSPQTKRPPASANAFTRPCVQTSPARPAAQGLGAACGKAVRHPRSPASRVWRSATAASPHSSKLPAKRRLRRRMAKRNRGRPPLLRQDPDAKLAGGGQPVPPTSQSDVRV